MKPFAILFIKNLKVVYFDHLDDLKTAVETAMKADNLVKAFRYYENIGEYVSFEIAT